VATLANAFSLLTLSLAVLAGCSDSPAPASPDDDPASPFIVTATVPGFITEKDPYPLIGSASHPANSWTWERSYNGGPYQFWAASQNTRFVAYAGEHHLQWRLTARRVADSVTDSDVQTTRICIGSGCGSSARTARR
jgi:hypothetical protein